MMIFAHLLLQAVLLAIGLVVAQAAEVYKYRMPNGEILFTNEISTSGALLEVLPEPAPTPKIIEAERRAKLERERNEAEQAIETRLATAEAAEAEIKAVLPELRKAKAAAAVGVEPLAGERLGHAGHRTRLADSYWTRQRELRHAVDELRQHLDAAYRVRDQTR